MPADVILYESQLQAFIERTVLSIQNARARLAKTSVPVLTEDFEIQFSGILVMDTGVNAISRENVTLAGGGTTKTSVVEPTQKTETVQEPEESTDETIGSAVDESSAKRSDTAKETTTRDNKTVDDSSEQQDAIDTNDQVYGRRNQVTTEYIP